MTTTPDFRALCAELLDELQYQTSDGTAAELRDRTHAALATPPPKPPTDEELHQLWLDEYAFHSDDGPTSGEVAEIARAVLERWGNH
jgi:hypothetical protein